MSDKNGSHAGIRLLLAAKVSRITLFTTADLPVLQKGNTALKIASPQHHICGVNDCAIHDRPMPKSLNRVGILFKKQE
jgi:hypothetical protein